MKKSSLLARIGLLQGIANDEELNDIHRLTLIDLLLDYINDKEIREAAEAIPL